MKSNVCVLTLLWVMAGCGTDGTLSGANPGAVANADGGAGADGSLSGEDGSGRRRGTADAAPELGSPQDVDSQDVLDAAPQVGAFEAPCTSNNDCESGLCLITENGKQCSKSCAGDCGSGYTCQQIAVSSGDISFACISRWTMLCNPCTEDSACNTNGSIGNRCLPWGAAGSFCGSECASAADCPPGYACEQYLDGGKPLMQCKPAGGAACSCNPRAQIQKASTTCFNASAPLSCKGTRACGAGGLSPCNIPTKPETCNGLDDNCNGETDEGLCSDGNLCTTDACNTDGSCKHEQLQGTPCDDGNACTATDKCGGSGKCVGGELKACDDGNVCTDNTCDPAGGCLFSSNKDPCNDGDACTLKDVCAEKKCGGSVPPNCDDKNQCTDDFCDAAKGCIHKAATKTDGAICDDGNVCTKDGCIGGKCAHVVDKSKPGC